MKLESFTHGADGITVVIPRDYVLLHRYRNPDELLPQVGEAGLDTTKDHRFVETADGNYACIGTRLPTTRPPLVGSRWRRQKR